MLRTPVVAGADATASGAGTFEAATAAQPLVAAQQFVGQQRPRASAFVVQQANAVAARVRASAFIMGISSA